LKLGRNRPPVSPEPPSAASTVLSIPDLVDQIAAKLPLADLSKAAGIHPNFAAAAKNPAVWKVLDSLKNPDTKMLSPRSLRGLERTPVQDRLHLSAAATADVAVALVLAPVLAGLAVGIGYPVLALYLVNRPLGSRVFYKLMDSDLSDRVAMPLDSSKKRREARAEASIEGLRDAGEKARKLLQDGLMQQDLPAALQAAGRKYEAALAAQQQRLLTSLPSQIRRGAWDKARTILDSLGDTAVLDMPAKQKNAAAAAALRAKQGEVVVFLLNQGASLQAGTLQAYVDSSGLNSRRLAARLIPRHAALPADLSGWESHLLSIFGATGEAGDAGFSGKLPSARPPADTLGANSPRSTLPTQAQEAKNPEYQRMQALWSTVSHSLAGPERLALVRDATDQTHRFVDTLTVLDSAKNESALQADSALVNALTAHAEVVIKALRVAAGPLSAAAAPVPGDGVHAAGAAVVGQTESEPQALQGLQTQLASCTARAAAYADVIHLGSLRDAVISRANEAVDRGSFEVDGTLNLLLRYGMPSDIRHPISGLRLQDRLETAVNTAVQAGDWDQAGAATARWSQVSGAGAAETPLSPANQATALGALHAAVEAGEYIEAGNILCVSNAINDAPPAGASASATAAIKLKQQLLTALAQADAPNAEAVAVLLKNYSEIPTGLPLAPVYRSAFQSTRLPILRGLIEQQLDSVVAAGDWQTAQHMLKGGACLTRTQAAQVSRARTAAFLQPDWRKYFRLTRLLNGRNALLRRN
jgi:hypothetical protein